MKCLTKSNKKNRKKQIELQNLIDVFTLYILIRKRVKIGIIDIELVTISNEPMKCIYNEIIKNKNLLSSNI